MEPCLYQTHMPTASLSHDLRHLGALTDLQRALSVPLYHVMVYEPRPRGRASVQMGPNAGVCASLLVLVVRAICG